MTRHVLSSSTCGTQACRTWSFSDPVGPLLFTNDGHGNFTHVPDAFRFKSPPQGSFTGMAAADYDRDGRVDIYICSYVYSKAKTSTRILFRITMRGMARQISFFGTG